MLPGLFPETSLANTSYTAYQKKFIQSQYNLRLGPPLIRQYRIKPGEEVLLFNVSYHTVFSPVHGMKVKIGGV